MKNLFVITEEEKNRILGLHESATKNQYLINEQPKKLSPEERIAYDLYGASRGTGAYDAGTDETEFVGIIEKINRNTHLSCLEIKKILQNNNIEKNILVEKINQDISLLDFIINEILKNVFDYEIKETIFEEEFNPYDGMMLVVNNANPLVLHKVRALKNLSVNRYTFSFIYKWF